MENIKYFFNNTIKETVDIIGVFIKKFNEIKENISFFGGNYCSYMDFSKYKHVW